MSVFAPMALRCGLYADDHAFLGDLLQASNGAVWQRFIRHVPGRNLLILWSAGLFRLTNGSVPALHAFSLALDAANAALVYFLVLELSGLASLAFPAALWFAVLPNHGETHFWFIQSVQCGLPMFFILSALLIAGRPRPALALRLPLAAGLFTLGLYTYEQIFCLWPLLLAVFWFRSEGKRRDLGLLFAGALYLFAAGAAQLALRYADPFHYGGPSIRLGRVPLRFFQSVYAALTGVWSWPIDGTLPRASTLRIGPADFAAPGTSGAIAVAAAVALAALLAGWLLVRLQKRLIAADRPALENYLISPSPLRLMLFGGAWFVLAYLPNYFWYLSPRHHYIPSLGWVLLLVGAAAWAASRWPRLQRVLPGLAVLLFVTDCVANIHEGSVWRFSAGLHRACLAETARFGPNPENLFLIGAPRYLGRTTAFARHADKVVALAYFDDFGLPAGLKLKQGDFQFAPTRRGAFYLNTVESPDPRIHFVPQELRWIPYERMNVIQFAPPDEFRCVRRLRLTDPEGKTTTRGLRQVAGCSRESELDMKVALVSATEAPAAKASAAKEVTAKGQAAKERSAKGPAAQEFPADAPPSIPAPGILGLELVQAVLDRSDHVLRLRLQWLVKRPVGFDFAVVPYVLSPDGRQLYSPLCDSHIPGPKLQVLWPLYDDELPPSGWRGGRLVTETYLLRGGDDVPPDGYRIRLELYRLRPGDSAAFLGTL